MLIGTWAGAEWAIRFYRRRGFELVPPESLLDDEQQQSLLYSADLELGETTKRIFEAIEEARPTRIVVDSLSEIRLLAQSSLRYRRQVLALKHYFARNGATVVMLDSGFAIPLMRGYFYLVFQSFITDVCTYWLDEYKIDGIRFDYTLGYFVYGDPTRGIPRLIADLKAHTAGRDNLAFILEHLTDNRYAAVDATDGAGSSPSRLSNSSMEALATSICDSSG